MLYIDSELRFLNLSNEQIGRIIKKLILENDFQEVLNDIETSIYNELKAKNDKRKDNIKQINIKGWEKRKAGAIQKEQKEDLPKRDLPIQQTNFKKSIYNNYKQLPSQNTQQTQKEKDFIKEYQSRGVLKL